VRALSSVGSEHLPYKQGVTGSNPVGPTLSTKSMSYGMDFFVRIILHSTTTAGNLVMTTHKICRIISQNFLDVI
jgi:hypothetical protein